ncbi:actin family [Syncephalis plumigaleata]|nr:actin family [Syncephalis plumigaleata]
MQQALRDDNIVALLCGSRYFRAHKGVSDPTRPPILPQFSSTVVSRKRTITAEQPASGKDQGENGETIEAEEEWVFGVEAESLVNNENSQSTAERPVQKGRIVDWTRFAALCDHIIFTQLGCRRVTNNSPIIMGIPEDWNKRERERITQILFEQLNAPAIMMMDQALLAAYGVGTTTGIVVDIGYETIVITPVIDGFVQRHASQRMNMGTADLDDYMVKLLQSPGQVEPSMNSSELKQLAQHLQQSSSLCHIPVSSKEKIEKRQVNYQGKQVTILDAHQKFAEPLFNPELVGKDEMSLQKAFHYALMACDVDKRVSISEYAILAGGGALLPGLRERLESELAIYFPSGENAGESQVGSVRFVGAPEYLTEYREHPELFGILGANILGKVALSDSKNFITKTDYNQRGPSVIHAKNP